MKHILPLLAALLPLAIPSGILAAADTKAAPQAIDLTVEYARQPLGIDSAHPRFSWKMKPVTTVRGQRQTAYRLLVASSPGLLKEGRGDVWDSGKIPSSESVLVDAPGLLLSPKTRYYWTVKLWDGKDQEGSFAAPTWFETGILDSAKWFEDGAKWIESPISVENGPEVEHWTNYVITPLGKNVPADQSSRADAYKAAETHYRELLSKNVWCGSLMRREFDASSIVSARLYITGLGYYRAYLNGKKIGGRDLAPSDSYFFGNVYYQAYDVTELIRDGRNSLGVELVNGRLRSWCLWDYEWDSETFYERPVLMARLELTDTSGRKQTIVTDEKWLCGESPVRKQAFWIGELYDANKFQAGWNTPDFKANGWVAARESKIGEKLRKFTFDPMPPEKMSAPIWPVGEKEPKPKVYVFDFGQQIGGRARFAFQNLKKGQRIVVRYSEIAGKDPTPEAGPLAYYDSFDNSKQDPDLLKYKGRGSVASSAFIEIPQPDGTSKREGIPGGAAVFSDMFVSAGEKSETWTPNFTYTGFRYLEILGLESRDQLKEISAYDLSTELNIVGSVDTDEPKLNKILKGAQRTIAVNLHSQFQDNNGSERGSFAFLVAVNDLNASYWINTYPFWHNVALSTVTVNSASNWPVGFCAGLRGPAHGKYKVIGITDSLHYGNLPYNLLAFFNDRKAADALLDWSLVFIKEASAERYWNNKTDGYADHIAETALLDLPGKDKEFIIDGKITSRSLFHGGALSSIADQGIQTATTLGLRAKAEKLRELIEPLKKKLVTTCRDSKTGVWTPDHPSKQGTDTALIYFNIEPREDDKKLCEEIIHEIHTVTNGHQITGSRLSYPLLHVLSQNGFVEEAYRLLMREEYPSLLNMINETNGTIRESWHTRDNFAQIEGLTAMSNWFYSDLVGISADINAPAFASFSLKPIVPSKVGRVNFSFESPRGTIQSLWERKKNEIVWNITVPPNSQAKIAIPSVSVADLKEGGKPISIQPGITSLEKNPEYQFYKIPSGNYQFSYPDAGQKPSQQTDSK